MDDLDLSTSLVCPGREGVCEAMMEKGNKASDWGRGEDELQETRCSLDVHQEDARFRCLCTCISVSSADISCVPSTVLIILQRKWKFSTRENEVRPE